MADFPVWRVTAVAQRVDHGVLEVRATPPGHEAVGLAVPALSLQKRGDDFGESFLHIDDRPVLVERQDFDFSLQDVDSFHRSHARLRRKMWVVRSPVTDFLHS